MTNLEGLALEVIVEARRVIGVHDTGLRDLMRKIEAMNAEINATCPTCGGSLNTKSGFRARCICKSGGEKCGRPFGSMYEEKTPRCGKPLCHEGPCGFGNPSL